MGRGNYFSFYEFLPYEQVLGTLAKLCEAFSRPSVPPSFRPHGTTRFPLNGFSLRLIFFSSPPKKKICLENSSLIQIWHEWWVRYFKTYVHLWLHLAQLSWDRDIFQTNVVQKINTHIFHSEAANQFIYLGLQINSKNLIREEIRLRIQAGNRSLFANKKLLKNKDLNAASKLQVQWYLG